MTSRSEELRDRLIALDSEIEELEKKEIDVAAEYRRAALDLTFHARPGGSETLVVAAASRATQLSNNLHVVQKDLVNRHHLRMRVIREIEAL